MKTSFLLLSAALLLAGCHAAPRAITLPTTAAVRAPIQAARTHVARSVDLGKQEAAILGGSAKGLSASQVRQVSALVAADQAEKRGATDQLTAALYQTGTLQRELDARQAQVDALAKHDAAMTAQVGVLEKARRHLWLVIVALVLADFFFGAPIQRGLHWLVSKCLSAVSTGYELFLKFVVRAAPLALFA